MDVKQTTVEHYHANAKALIAYASTLVGPSRAEDLVADAMMPVFDRVDLGRVANPRAYLYKCVLNQARAAGRSATARRRREALVATVAPRFAPPPETIDELGLLSALSTRERAVIFLTYWEDLPVAEVAAWLDLAEGTVRKYLARARAKIRKELT